jgi:hypothetical protein
MMGGDNERMMRKPNRILALSRHFIIYPQTSHGTHCCTLSILQALAVYNTEIFKKLRK